MNKIRNKFFILVLVFIMSFCIINNSYAIVADGSLDYEGIDVSDWQGYIDYEEVKNSGIDIVYIKSSQGSDIKDAYFELNYENAKSNGLKVGFYHFLTATTVQEAEDEAEFFASVISGKTSDCKLVLDYEVFSGASVNQINEIALAFLEKTTELTGKDVILYSDLSNAQDVFNETVASNYELWIAYYGNYEDLSDYQTSWSEYIGVQYSDEGEIDGISGSVDRDLFSSSIFLDENDVTEIRSTGTITTDYNTKAEYYTVEDGNTLAEIAEKYGTTVEEIADLNDIKNENLIYPGEKLRILTNTNIEGNEQRQMQEIIYTVEKGNTLTQIANAYNVSISSLEENNNIANPNLIYPGEKIRITGSDSDYLNPITSTSNEYYIVKSGDTLCYIARMYKTSVAKIMQDNSITNPNLIYPGQRIRI